MPGTGMMRKGLRRIESQQTRRTLNAMNHAQLDSRSLAFAHAIAERLLAQPELVEVGRKNLRRWMAAESVPPARMRNCREWLEIIEQHPVEEVVRILTLEDEQGQRLRQNNPFAGVLSQQEVLQMKKEFARHAAD